MTALSERVLTTSVSYMLKNKRLLGCEGIAGGLRTTNRVVASSAKHPCLEETVLCNKQCHLLGGVGMVSLWSVLKMGCKWFWGFI